MINFLKKFGYKKVSDTLRQQLGVLLQSSKKSDHSLSDIELMMLTNTLNLDKITVSDVMIPRADIISISRDIQLEQLQKIVAQNPFTRLVVHHNTLDDVKGFIHVKDIYQLLNLKNFSIKSIIRKPLLVVESMPIIDLLLSIRRTQIPMALVIDEFGGVDGLLTTWDVVRHIFGELENSHEPDIASLMTERSDGSFEADARLPIEQFTELFGIELTPEEEDDEIDTVGGLIVWLAGRVPERCELIQHPAGIEFEILEADPRRIIKVVMRHQSSTDTSTSTSPARY